MKLPHAPRLSYGAQKLVCEILIDDYTRRGYIDGRALRLPAVLVRPGRCPTPRSRAGRARSSASRSPAATMFAPSGPTRASPASRSTKVVQSFIHASALLQNGIGKKRTLLLNGISVSAQQMWDAVKDKATGKVRFAPDPAISVGHGWRAEEDVFQESLEFGFPVTARHR